MSSSYSDANKRHALSFESFLIYFPLSIGIVFHLGTLRIMSGTSVILSSVSLAYHFTHNAGIKTIRT